MHKRPAYHSLVAQQVLMLINILRRHTQTDLNVLRETEEESNKSEAEISSIPDKDDGIGSAEAELAVDTGLWPETTGVICRKRRWKIMK